LSLLAASSATTNEKICESVLEDGAFLRLHSSARVPGQTMLECPKAEEACRKRSSKIHLGVSWADLLDLSEPEDLERLTINN